MRKNRQLAIGITVIVVALVGLVVAQGMMVNQTTYGRYGHGMMGGTGMMGGQATHGRSGQGMMGGQGMMEIYPASAEPIPESEALGRLESFAGRFGTGVSIEDFMVFSNHYYAQIVGADGIGLAEVLVDRYTGVLHPEPGPNMMWNTRFGMGMMGARGSMQPARERSPAASVRYDETAARDLAESFLTDYLPGAQVLHGQAFHGYYTFDFGRETIEGMLSVSAATGEVWLHTWHGPYLGGHD